MRNLTAWASRLIGDEVYLRRSRRIYLMLGLFGLFVLVAPRLAPGLLPQMADGTGIEFSIFVAVLFLVAAESHVRLRRIERRRNSAA